MSIIMEDIKYNLPENLHKLKYKRMNPLEWVVSLLMDSHVCQICGRKEWGRVSGWLLFESDNPKHKDKYGCSAVCCECENANPEIFSLPQIKKFNFKEKIDGTKS